MKTPEEFAREIMHIAYSPTFYGERARGLIAAAAAARDAEVRAAALAETEAIAVAVRYMALRDIPHIFVTSAAPYFDRIVDDIRALAAPASTPKPPESAEPCGRYERGPVAYMCRNCGDHVDRHLQASQFSAAPPKGEAPKAKCHTCEGDGKVGRPRNATTCPTCRGTGDAP